MKHYSPSQLMKNTFLCVLIVLLGYSQVSAQSLISRYQFASSSGTYTAITGGTVWQSGATLATNAVTNVTLPFTFNFNGTNYTTINISNNGFITFGATAPAASDYAALSTSTSYSGAIVGYGLNLVNSPVGGTTPEIRYEQVGSEFIIQFQDLGRTGISGDRMNFQIRLTQTTNTIKIVYGTWAATTTTTAAANMGQVGLRGASNTDYSGRNVNATSPYSTWASSGGSTATLNTNTGTMRYNNAFLPASGLTFTWTLNSAYSTLPYTQNFETSPWGNRNSLQDAASNTSMSTFPQLGNPAWKRQDETTANSLWTSTSGALATLTGAQGTGVARFHSYYASSGAKGYMDFYLDFSTAGTKQLTFDYQNTTGTDNLQVALSTDGGLTFSNVGSPYGVAASWTGQTVSSLSSSTSSTVVLRFIATSDFGDNDIGVDNVNIFVPITPTISGFSPSPNLCLSGGQTITISGTNFTGATAVTFNGVNAGSFTVVNSTTITAITPASLTAGVISVTTAGGSASSGLYTVVTNPTVAVSPTSNSLCVPGASAIALTASGANTYTWGPSTGLSATAGTSVNALPTSTTTYTVTGTDGNGCTATATSAFTVTAGVSATASASPLNVCNGANSQLDVVAVQGGGLSVIGAGASTSSSTAASFFPGFWGGAKTQYIVLGSELIAQGLKAGNITALAYEPTTAGQTYQGFFISLGTTAQSSMTTSFITTGLTEVYAGTLADNGILPVANTVNTLTFGTGGTASAFNWDGSSNIVVSISWSSVPNASTATSSTMKVDAPGFTCSAYDQQDNVSPATMKASTTADGTGTNRPRFTFTGNKLVVSPTYAWTESPATTLTSTSIANPMSNGITATNNYTVTVTGAGGCTATSTLTVNVAGSVVCSAIASSNGATLCAGQNTTLTASATIGGTPYTYDWTADASLSATNIANPVATPTATTTYTCTVTDACGTTCSTTITINVNALPTVGVSPTSGTICNPGGTSVSLTASGTATGYTWLPATGLSATSGASVNATPSSSTTYTVTGTDAIGCTNTATAVITVSSVPSAVTVSPSSSTICSGDVQLLTASGGSPSATIGSGTSFTGATTQPTAFCNRWGTYYAQQIYTAAELLAAGYVAGNITSLSFNVNSLGDAATNDEYTVKIGHVGSTSTFSSTSFLSTASYTTVYGPVTHTHTASGWQLITFSSPFNWNGVDNICIDVFHKGADLTNNATTQFTTTAGNTTLHYTTSSLLSNPPSSTGNLSTSRLNIRLEPLTSFPITWSPTIGLFTDITATTAYTGGAATAVYASPSSTQVYTATATNASGCTSTGTTTVTISTGASITTDPANTSACTNSNASFTVVATGPGLTYQWFVDDGTGFAPISPGAPYSGETSATLTISNPSASLDNYQYQVEVSSTCGSAVTSQPATLTVNTPASVTTNPTSGLICNPGGTAVSVTASGANTYTWAPTSGLTPSTGATVSANPSSTTTYTVTGVDGNGCTATSTLAITVSSVVPALTTSAAPATICSGNSSTINVGVASVPLSYCAASQSTGECGNADEFISNVTIGSINNTTTCAQSLPSGYNSYIAQSTAIVAGNSLAISVGNGNYYSGDLCRVYVDWNQDGDFVDAGEETILTGTTTFTGNIAAPVGAINGSTRMRVRLTYTTGMAACGVSSYGETEDYTLVVSGGASSPIVYTYLWNDPNTSTSASTSVNPTVNTNYTVTVSNAAGCTATSSVTVTTIATPSVPTTVGTYAATINQADGTTQDYLQASGCVSLASITDASGGNVLGNTTVTQVLSTTVPSPNVDGYIYGRRKYTVNAASTGAATVKLYFTQADFDDYNASNSNFLDLPTSGNNSDPNKPYFRIARVNGAAYTISGSLGDSLVWNSTDSRWEVNFPVTDVNADYYFVSMASCSGINVANLQATNIQGTSVTATWDNLVTTPAWGWYSLQYRTTQPTPGSWVNAGTSNGGTTSRLIIGLAPGTEYELQIRRHCSSQSEGPWSTGVIFSTTSPTCALAPTLTASTINSNNATITWPSVAGAGWLEIRYKESSSGTWISAGTLGGTATSKLFTGLSASTSYDVEVRSYCASNSQPGAWGSVTFATTALSGCALPPTLAATTVNATNITISWTSTGAAWYEFRYKETSSGTWISAGTLGGAATSRQFTGLSASTSYDFQARSFCANGQPSAWDGITQATAALSGCALPPVLTTATVTSKMFTGLTASTSYDFQARSFCSNGQPSAWGGITQATNGLSGCELPPAFTTPSTTSTTMNVTWPSVAGAGWYEFRYRIVGAPSWTTGGTLGGAATSKGLIGLQASTNYEFEGRTFCANGQPSAWGSVSFTTGASMMPILFEEETAKAGFMVYPNPTRDQITIEFSTETLQATKVKVLDMTGRVVKTVEAVPQAGEHQYTLSLSELSAGMYTVQVYTDDKLSYVTKVQKQD
jgi:hypothetical protein